MRSERYLQFLGFRDIGESKVGNYFYQFLIFALISWKIVYVFVKFLQNGEVTTLFDASHSLVIVFQFILSKIYLKKNHFIDTIDNQESKGWILKSILTIFIVSFAYSLATLIVNLTTDTILIYKNLSKWFSFLIIVEEIYTNNIYLSNLLIFGTIFLTHSHSVEELAKSMKENIRNLILIDLLLQYNQLRNSYNKSVELLNRLFTFTVLFGSLSVYLLFLNILQKRYDSNDFNSYINAIYFLVMILIYFFSMGKIKSSIQEIKNVVMTDEFIKKYLDRQFQNIDMTVYLNKKASTDRSSFGSFTSDEEEKFGTSMVRVKKSIDKMGIDKMESRDLQIKDLFLNLENAKTLDWQTIYMIVNEKWDTFEFLGFQVEDSAVIKKIATFVVFYFSTTGLWSQLVPDIVS